MQVLISPDRGYAANPIATKSGGKRRKEEFGKRSCYRAASSDLVVSLAIMSTPFSQDWEFE